MNKITVKDATPYWLDPDPKQGSYTGKSLPRKADVIVIDTDAWWLLTSRLIMKS